MGVLEGEDCEREVGEGKEEEQVDCSSSLEWEALEDGPVRGKLCSEVHVVQHEGTCSDEVYCLILHLF